MNWHNPLIWSQIETAARIVGWRMSSQEIVNELRKQNADTFRTLNRTTVNGWIDQTGDRPRWMDATLENNQKGNDPGHNKGGQRGILVRVLPFAGNIALTLFEAPYPDVVEVIKKQLKAIRGGSGAVAVITA